MSVLCTVIINYLLFLVYKAEVENWTLSSTQILIRSNEVFDVTSSQKKTELATELWCIITLIENIKDSYIVVSRENIQTSIAFQFVIFNP